MTEYRWTLTAQNGKKTSSHHGTLEIPDGWTRRDALGEILRQQQIDPTQWEIVFFSLEPNQLGGGAR